MDNGRHKEPQMVEEPDLSGSYTARDYLTWRMETLVELIRGKIFKMTPAPTTNHQRISGELYLGLRAFFKGNSCQSFIAPFDVYLVHEGEDYKNTPNIVQPDLCVVCDASKIKSFGCVGSPDLVVEILSPSTARKDQTAKKELYAEYGVPEYWVVFPEERTLQVFKLLGGYYHLAGTYAEEQQFHSLKFPGMKISLKEVFMDVTQF